jgi:hypothetical protein
MMTPEERTAIVNAISQTTPNRYPTDQNKTIVEDGTFAIEEATYWFKHRKMAGSFNKGGFSGADQGIDEYMVYRGDKVGVGEAYEPIARIPAHEVQIAKPAPAAPTAPPYRDGADTQAAPTPRTPKKRRRWSLTPTYRRSFKLSPQHIPSCARPCRHGCAALVAYDGYKGNKTRTADSKERQAYSTPPPLAAIGAEAADGAAVVVEPTAGNGGLLAPLGYLSGVDIRANELDPERAGRLADFLTAAVGRPVLVSQGDYADENYQSAIESAAKKGNAPS